MIERILEFVAFIRNYKELWTFWINDVETQMKKTQLMPASAD